MMNALHAHKAILKNAHSAQMVIILINFMMDFSIVQNALIHVLIAQLQITASYARKDFMYPMVNANPAVATAFSVIIKGNAKNAKKATI